MCDVGIRYHGMRENCCKELGKFSSNFVVLKKAAVHNEGDL